MDRNTTIEEHYKKNYKSLVGMMSRKTPNFSKELAEEVVQEAYTLALKYWKSYNPEKGQFSTWFRRILNNSLNMCHRNEKGIPSLDNEEDNLEPFIIDNGDFPRELVVAINKAIEEQSEPVAEVLTMFFHLGMNAREISECTYYTHNNVRQIIMRFRLKQEGENIYNPS